MTRDWFPETNGLCACGHRAIDHFPTFRYGCALVDPETGETHHNPGHVDRNECMVDGCGCSRFLPVAEGSPIPDPLTEAILRILRPLPPA